MDIIMEGKASHIPSHHSTINVNVCLCGCDFSSRPCSVLNSKVQQNLELIFMRGKCPPALLLATAGVHNMIGEEVLMLSRMVLNLVRLTAAGLLFHDKITQMLHALC